MSNITTALQIGKGSAISRLERNAQKAEKRGDLTAAERFRQAAEFLKKERPGVWG